jgi:tetratricopeptide (TPR) repeat protein
MSSREFSRTEWIFCLLLALATVAVYGGVFSSDFIRFDDPRYIAENRHVREGLTLDGAVWALTAYVKSNWHPLTLLSHMLDVELYGLSAGGHHATNLLLHVANSLLLFAVLRSATRAPRPSALVAALFALHPTHVESVAWVSERKDVLSTLFWLLATASYVAYARRGGIARYAATALLLVAGLASKAMLMTLPFVFLLLDYWPLGRLRFDRSALRLLVEKLPLLAIVAAVAAAALAAQISGGAVALGDPVPFHLRAANAAVSYGLYVWKTVWPVDLALLYPHPNLPGGTPWQAWQVVLAGAGLLGASLVFLWARGHRYLAVGWLWFLGTLLPVIGIVQVGTQGIADRYTYVPCIGLYIIAAWGSADLTRATSRRAGGFGAAGALVAVVVLAALAVVSHRQVGYWRDTVPLFEHSLAVAPGAYPLHNNLGNELLDRGQLDEAIRHYRRALEIKPDHITAHKGLGNALRQRGELYEATRHSLLGRRVRLDSLEGELQLGDALLREKDPEAALDHFRRAARFAPNSEVIQRALGQAHMDLGRPDEATLFYRRAVELAPDSYSAHRALALALMHRRDLPAAISEYREVVRIRPESARDLHQLGHLLRAAGDLDGAVLQYRRAVAAAPGEAVPRLNLGDTLLARGDLDEAIVSYREAIVIEPDNPAARERLERALRMRTERAGGAQSLEMGPGAGAR